MANENELNRYRADAVRVRGEMAKRTSTVAMKRKKAADARAAAQRSTSAITIRLRLADADRAEGEGNAAEKTPDSSMSAITPRHDTKRRNVVGMVFELCLRASP